MREGGRFERDDNRVGHVPGTKRYGPSLPPPGGGADPGRTLLRAVLPRAGGVLRGGDLSQALSADYQTGQDREDLHDEQLVEALDRVRWELAGRIVEAGRH